MKQILTLLLLLCTMTASAQDIIVKKDGTPIKCRIVEETKDEITFKKWENLEGDNYVMNRSDIQTVTRDENPNIWVTPSVPEDMPRVSDDFLRRLDYERHLSPQTRRLHNLKWTAIGTAIAAPVFAGLMFLDYSGEDPSYRLSMIGISFAAAATAITTGIWYGVEKHKVKRNIYAASFYEQGYTFKNGTRFSASTDLLRDSHTNNTAIGIGFHYNF